MKECVLELKNISYSYDKEAEVLKNINIKIHKGERIGVIGNNGAGKSTFFLLLNGILFSDTGSIALYGEKIKNNRKDILRLRKEVGYVFQDPDNQIIAPTVESELSFGLINMKAPKDVIKEKLNHTIHQLGLEKYRTTPPHYLSGGEKKRVSIGDIVVMEPNVLLFDEPTSSLDHKNIQVFEAILEEQLKQGTTALISTHDYDFIWKWADRILVFHEGELVGDDTTEKIFTNQSLLDTFSLKKPAMLKMIEMIAEIRGRQLPERLPKNEEMLHEYMKEILEDR